MCNNSHFDVLCYVGASRSQGDTILAKYAFPRTYSSPALVYHLIIWQPNRYSGRMKSRNIYVASTSGTRDLSNVNKCLFFVSRCSPHYRLLSMINCYSYENFVQYQTGNQLPIVYDIEY